MKCWAWVFVCFSCLLSGQDLITDRPDQTESSETVQPGSVQLEIGMTHAEKDDFEVDAIGETLVRIGLFPKLELRLGFDGFIDASLDLGSRSAEDDGTGDSGIGIKWKLAEEKGKRPQIAMICQTSLPTGDDEFTSDNEEPAARLTFAHTLNEKWGVAYNLGVAGVTEVDGNGEHTLSVWQYTLTAGVGLSERLSAFFEVFGDVPLSAPGGPANSFDCGLTWLLSPVMQLDLAAGTGLSEAADDWFVTCGFSVRLGG